MPKIFYELEFASEASPDELLTPRIGRTFFETAEEAEQALLLETSISRSDDHKAPFKARVGKMFVYTLEEFEEASRRRLRVEALRRLTVGQRILLGLPEDENDI
jgi:hypothetical protein